jgi:YfiR/HmsC-like
MTEIFAKRRIAAALAGALALFAAGAGISRAADAVTPSALKAAFLFNFAKFADWSAVQPSVTLVLCVANDDALGAALGDSVRGQRIETHPIEVRKVKADGSVAACHLLFVPASDARQALAKIGAGTEALLTVSDAPGFAQSGGLIELFQENGRMRFAVNVDTARRSGIRLSSRLLDLAKIVRTDHGQ